jgi:deazaflavin-dependent oxidoreductase (nitroreductase family)
MGMTSAFQQKTTGAMTYPRRGTLNRLLFRTPLIWWRMGLAPLLGRWMLVLTTWGRKSGLPRHTMLSYALCQGRLYLLPGWAGRSDWVRNLQADPSVTVQLGHSIFSASARQVTHLEEYTAVAEVMFAAASAHWRVPTGGDSHFRPWLASLDIAYDARDLVAHRDRAPIVALDPSDRGQPSTGCRSGSPPPLPEDLTWLWGLALASFAAGWLLGRWSGRSKPPL